MADHGRTAKCNKGKISAALADLMRGATSSAVAIVTGGQGGRISGPVLDAIWNQQKRLGADAFREWINSAGNEEVALWAIASAKQKADANEGKKSGTWGPVLRDSGVRAEHFLDGATVEFAAEATMRLLLHLENLALLSPSCVNEHAEQALAIALFGGPRALEVLKTARKKKPARPFKTGFWSIFSSGPSKAELAKFKDRYVAWTVDVIRALREFRDGTVR